MTHHQISLRPPLHHAWRIEGVGSYIGKYKHISRSTQHYSRNVINILDNKPYRKGSQTNFGAYIIC
jgi:hypothetical protein